MDFPTCQVCFIWSSLVIWKLSGNDREKPPLPLRVRPGEKCGNMPSVECYTLYPSLILWSSLSGQEDGGEVDVHVQGHKLHPWGNKPPQGSKRNWRWWLWQGSRWPTCGPRFAFRDGDIWLFIPIQKKHNYIGTANRELLLQSCWSLSGWHVHKATECNW